MEVAATTFRGGFSSATMKGQLTLGTGKSFQELEMKGSFWFELSGGILCWFKEDKGELMGVIAVSNTSGFLPDDPKVATVELVSDEFCATLTAATRSTKLFPPRPKPTLRPKSMATARE